MTREQALRVVREVLEEWVLVGIWHHMTLASIEGASLTVVCEDEHANKGWRTHPTVAGSRLGRTM